MTSTERRSPGSAARPLVVTGAIGLVLGVVAATTTGAPGLWGVLVGALLTFASLGLGSLVLAWVADVTPAMSLVVALMTYTLQVVLLLAAYVVLQGDEAARTAVSGPWLGGTVIATTVVWLALQVRGLWTARQPYFDLPAEGSSEDTSRGRSGATEAGTT